MGGGMNNRFDIVGKILEFNKTKFPKSLNSEYNNQEKSYN